MFTIAVDGGTGSVRAVIFDEHGTQIAAHANDWEHLPVPNAPGAMAFDYATNTELMLDAITQCVTKAQAAGCDPTQVRALATSSMREGFVLLDEHGQEIWGCANVDARSEEQVRTLQTQANLEQHLYQRTGQTFALSAQPRLAWIQQHEPTRYEQAATLLMLGEWMLYKLCGEMAMEPANGSTSGLLALDSRQGDDSLLTDCGLRGGLLPPVVEPGTVIGSLLPAIAQRTGLPEDLACVVGGGDVQCAALGAGLVHAGEGLIGGGTFWQTVVNIASPVVEPDMKVRINAASIPNMWQAEAIVFHVGIAMRWFRATFAQGLYADQLAGGPDAFGVLDDQAAAIPVGANGIVPVFSDVMNYAQWYHAAPSFLNLPLDIEGDELIASMYRALLENAACVSWFNLRIVEDFTNTHLDHIVLSGGGAKSPLWAQILADTLGKQVYIPKVKETTALGTAMCAATGAGMFASVQDAAQAWVTWERIHEPNPELTAHYQELAQRWAVCYAPQVALVDKGLTTSMWRAPGA